MNSPIAGSVLDVLDDLVLAFDGDGTIREWNTRVEEVTSYSDETLSKRAPGDFVAADHADRLSDAVDEALELGESSVEADLVTAAGERIPYEFDVMRLPADARAVAVVGREDAESAGVAPDRQAILERISDAFLTIDEDWRIAYANDRASSLLSQGMDRDVDPAEIEGVHLWEEFADAVGTPFYERYHEVLETQTPATFEEYYDPLDTWFEVSAYPSDNGLSIYFRDVTEKHRQRERLKEQDRVLRSMYEIISDRDRSFSMQVQDLLALGREVLGTKYSSFSHIRGDTYVFEAVDAADDSLQTGDAVPLSHTHCEVAADTEKTLVLGDVARDAPEQTERVGYTEWGISCYLGAPVFVEDEVYGTFCFYDEEARSDQFSDWHVTLVDLMSRWIGYELQRQRTNERLRDQNDKLERFTSIVSHDIRNPLNVARGQLDLAKEACDSDHLDEIKRSHDRIESLVDGLLGLARAGDVIDHQETVALDRAVERWLEGVPTESASLRVDSGRRIEADEDRLQQLFENLIRNAVEHGGSDVTVTVGDVDGGFYVADDGPGIPPAERDNVLESGYSTADDGNGLGLAIVREIAEAHGWNVRVTGSQDSDVSDGPAESNGERDRPSGGARFEFTGVVDTE